VHALTVSVLGPLPMIMLYIMYFRFFDDVTFSHNGAYSVGNADVGATLQQIRGPLFDFVVVVVAANCASTSATYERLVETNNI